MQDNDAVESAPELEQAPSPAGDVPAPQQQADAAADRGSLPTFADIDSEATTQEDAPAEEAPAPERVAFDNLDDKLGVLDKDAKQAGFWEKVDERHINELPATAKGIIREVRIAAQKQVQAAQAQVEQLKGEAAAWRADLDRREQDLAERNAQFAGLVNSPALQRLMTAPEVSPPDPTDPASIKAYIDAQAKTGIAEQWRTAFSDVAAAAERERKMAKLRQFNRDHPEMSDSKFRSEVVSLIKQRQEVGRPVLLEDAYNLVRGRRQEAAHKAREAKEQRARAASMLHVGRGSRGGGPAEHNDIPMEIKKGGAVAIARFLRENPKFAERYRANL